MMAPTTNGWHVDPRRERVTDELRNYIRYEFKEKSADWLLARRETKH